MLRATSWIAVGAWSGDPADVVVLSLDERHRRRIKMTGVRGLVFLLDLLQPVTLRGGDGLVLEDGRVVEVVAAPEPLIEICCSDVASLVRMAWHLGNRHLPVQVFPNRLRIRRDPVIEEMLRNLGARLTQIETSFDPEGGAYSSGSIAAVHAHGPDTHLAHSEHAHAFDHAPYSPMRDPAAHHHERMHVDPHPHLQALNDERFVGASAKPGIKTTAPD